jgi:rod shape-determining protein MreC
MAPPRNRRPGFSRRIQFGLFIGYVIAVIGVVCALALVMLSRLDPVGFSALRALALDASAPMTAGGRSVIRGIQNTENNITAYFQAGSQNQALRAEMAQARRELIHAQTLHRQNIQFRKMLKLIEHDSETVVTARLIGSSLSSARRFGTLAAGAQNGVRPEQPVISVDGLVGRVLEVGNSASRILLLTDPESTVPVRLTRSGTAALARGRGDGRLRITSLLPGARPFRKGDVVTTSGTGGLYPPDVPVAVITEVEGDTATAWPLANPATVDFAVVRKPYQPPLPPSRLEEPPSK